MEPVSENKIILILRETRLEELKARFNTVAQARFYVERLGSDFDDYEREDHAYHRAVADAHAVLATLGRVQKVHRRFLPNFVFGPSDIAVAVGQDGLVANALKYLHVQPLVGVNPEPARYDGLLLPFSVADLRKVIPEVIRKTRPTKSVTMAKATLNDGRLLYAVNDLFIGPRSHGSARYRLEFDGRNERQSSSGVIVSTGLGSTGWFSSLVAGAQGLVAQIRGQRSPTLAAGAARMGKAPPPVALDWSTEELLFTVREPFPSKTTSAEVVFGRIRAGTPLVLESLMSERGVIFSDGVEADFLDFNSGARAEITLAERKGTLVL